MRTLIVLALAALVIFGVVTCAQSARVAVEATKAAQAARVIDETAR